ncbi:MAG: type I-E CRISPR-associated protein Cse2/CasB [Thermoplasmata archaeon]|jgi:CRISPR type I-E-associated protein CasB/Cse2|nr:type I-E CRISPR-associated protein Cse2/CasB [Thermoplasmata archaeon]
MSELSKEEFEGAVANWWYRLQNDSGSSARLRHQSDIIGIQTVAAFYDLVRALPQIDTDVLACIAMVLSHVEADSKEKVAVRMGKKTSSADHVVSEIRFNKLISLDLEGLSRELVRVLPIIDNTLNIRALATDLRYWNYESQISKKRWLNDFYLA